MAGGEGAACEACRRQAGGCCFLGRTASSGRETGAPRRVCERPGKAAGEGGPGPAAGEGGAGEAAAFGSRSVSPSPRAREAPLAGPSAGDGGQGARRSRCLPYS